MVQWMKEAQVLQRGGSAFKGTGSLKAFIGQMNQSLVPAKIVQLLDKKVASSKVAGLQFTDGRIFVCMQFAFL